MQQNSSRTGLFMIAYNGTFPIEINILVVFSKKYDKRKFSYYSEMEAALDPQPSFDATTYDTLQLSVLNISKKRHRS